VRKLKALYSGTLKASLAYELEDQQRLAAHAISKKKVSTQKKKQVSSHTLIWKNRCNSRTRNQIRQKKSENKIKNKMQ
jgi:hypothetical protein